MTKLFWAVVALDAIVFVVLMVLGLTERGHSDGGREMSLIFFVIVPAIIIAGAVLLFNTAEPGSARRFVALIIVAGPGLLLGATRVRSAAIDYQVRRNSEGTGYFSGSAMRDAGAAVVKHDTAALLALKGRIEPNVSGRHGMTLMQLALENADASVVRTLLALGADPNLGLEYATKLPDITILRTLLDAGAKPAYSTDRDIAVMQWLGVMPLANFTLLLDRGLDPNLTDRLGNPLVMECGRADRWDFVLLLMDRGADATRADGSGMHLSDVVQSRVESTSSRPPEVKADIARVKARLK